MRIVSISDGVGSHHTREITPGATELSTTGQNRAIVFSDTVEAEILSGLHRTRNIIIKEEDTMHFVASIIKRIMELLGESVSIVPTLGEQKIDSLELKLLKEFARPFVGSLGDAYPIDNGDTITLPIRLQSQPLLSILYPRDNIQFESDAHLIRSTIQTVVDILSAKYIAGRRELANLKKANEDPLLEILGRRAFNNVMRNYRSLSYSQDKIPISILIIDLDLFKKVNDTHGHNIGDRVLKHVTEIIRGECASYFGKGNAELYRIGGEELACILENSDAEEAMLFAENINAKLRDNPFNIDGESQIIQTASIGIATATSHQDFKKNSQEGIRVLAHADIALYVAKETRDRAIAFSPEQPRPSIKIDGERRGGSRNKD